MCQVRSADVTNTNPFPVWFSTGTRDTIHPVSAVKRSANAVSSFRPEFAAEGRFNVSFRTFSGGHSLSNPQELGAAIAWWLTGPPSIQG